MEQSQITIEDMRRIAQEVVTAALDDLPTYNEVERIVSEAVEKQARLYDERDTKRARESYDMMNSVDRHLRAVEISMGQVAQNVSEFKGVISALPDLKLDVDRVKAELHTQSTTLAVVQSTYSDLKEDIFGESAGKPPSLYRLLDQRAARADEQHEAVMHVLKEDISPRVERAEKYIESRRELEQKALKVIQVGWKYISASKVRFTVFVGAVSLITAKVLDPALLDGIVKTVISIMGGG